MRTIKFRGRDGNGNWHYGDLEHSPIGKFCRIHEYWDNGLYKSQYDVNSETVGQFAGMHDIAGRPIYEGDIVRSDLITPHEVFYDENTAKFMLRNEIQSQWVVAIGELAGLEVIGNVYDSPWLLKGGEK